MNVVFQLWGVVGYLAPLLAGVRHRVSAKIWLDQSVNTSPIELVALAVGHTALGLIVGYAFFEWASHLPG
jgi:hypothetical protein